MNYNLKLQFRYFLDYLKHKIKVPLHAGSMQRTLVRVYSCLLHNYKLILIYATSHAADMAKKEFIKFRLPQLRYCPHLKAFHFCSIKIVIMKKYFTLKPDRILLLFILFSLCSVAQTWQPLSDDDSNQASYQTPLTPALILHLMAQNILPMQIMKIRKS